MPGSRCFSCKRTRPVTFSVRRQAGGNYRTAQRSYSSTMCSECVLSALSWVRTSSNTDGVDSRTIVRIAEELLAADPTLTATEWVRDEQADRWRPSVRKEMPVAFFVERYRAQRAAERARYEQRRSGDAIP